LPPVPGQTVVLGEQPAGEVTTKQPKKKAGFNVQDCNDVVLLKEELAKQKLMKNAPRGQRQRIKRKILRLEGEDLPKVANDKAEAPQNPK